MAMSRFGAPACTGEPDDPSASGGCGMSRASAEQPRDDLLPVREDLRHLPPDEGCGDLAQRRPGKPITHVVPDRRAASRGLEYVLVNPERVGTVELLVDEAERRLPRSDERSPAEPDPEQPEPVVRAR